VICCLQFVYPKSRSFVIDWKDFTYKTIYDYCNLRGNRTFTLKEFYSDNEIEIENFKPKNRNREAKIRQQLQFLRDDGLLTFVDNRGTYTLRGIDILDGEVEDEIIKAVKHASPEKREYLVETYVRDIGWVKEAKKILGLYCIYMKCKNTFLKENGDPYIETHHIIPLCKGGEDGLWNISVLCAHHHRMAHYADVETRIKMEKVLLKEVECRI